MNILILDDSHEKVALIAKTIKSSGLIANITHETNVTSARQRLRSNYFDLLLIDIQIPDTAGATLNRMGGLEFFDIATQDLKAKIPAEILFVTSEDSLVSEAQAEVERRGSSLCAISKAQVGWDQMLIGKIQIASKRAKRNIENADIAIITALESELDAVLSLDYKWDKFRIDSDPTLYYRGKFSSGGIERVVVAASAMRKGMAASAAVATKLVLKFRPKILAMTGICAGVRGKTNLGDVIVGSPTWDWGSGKHAEDKSGSPVFKLSPKQSDLSNGLSVLCSEVGRSQEFKSRVRAQWQKKFPEGIFNCHIGPMASGASVIANESIAKSIVEQNRDVIGIEMEAFAVMVAAEYATATPLIAIAIKSVCDFADSHKEDFWQEYAAYTSVLFADELFKLYFEQA